MESDDTAISTHQGVRVSPFHDPFSKGNLAYADVFKIGHENYRAGLIDQMQRGRAPAEEQRVRLPNATYRDRMTLYLGGKEIQILLVESVTNADLDRVIEILEQYRDAEFGMVDAATMAIAERLKIEVILTLDHRDFSIYRPRHCPAFRLVP
jgi:hypothetical protein